MNKRLVAVWILVVLMLSACASTGSGGRSSGGRQTGASVNTQLGVEYLREGMYESALDKLKKALKQDYSYQPAHSTIAVLYERLGEKKLAEKHYRKAYSLDSKDPLTLNNYGQFLCRNERYEEADRMFNTALMDPLYRQPETTLTNVGLCAVRQSEQDKAIEYFRKALARNPKYPPALREMARISAARKHWLAVRAYLQRLQEIDSLTPELLWLGVQAERELGDRDALSSYALLLKNRYPESEEARLLVEWERAQSGR
jgi:type IV pilus assembly protein PilF